MRRSFPIVWHSRSSALCLRRLYISRHLLVTPISCQYPRLASTLVQSSPDLPLSDAQKSTIYALSTVPGKAGVGVIRVSGPHALDVWHKMVKRKHAVTTPEPWKMYRCDIVSPQTDNVLDNGLAVFFRGPRSFTTEDVLELHIHSGRAIVASVLSALARVPFCRPAEAGEFTRRAFIGGRMDLTQVEGLKDLIDAETETQRKFALRTAGGAIREQYDHLRTEAIKCLSLVEALIDFSEGDDIEDGIHEQARKRSANLLATINSHLEDSRRGEVLRTGIRLAIFGPPNAGKSTLLNFLAQREAAIVTPVPGTTRDILEVSLDIDGLPVTVLDTAGIRDATNDPIEKIGIDRALQRIADSDISLCVLDATVSPPYPLQKLFREHTHILLNKSDLLPPDTKPTEHSWMVSLKNGTGTLEFLKGLSKVIKSRFDLDDMTSLNTPLVTRERHRIHLQSACQFLDSFIRSDDVVIGAEDLRYAVKEIGKISGTIDTEDILDAVFRDFCIGK